MKAKLLLLVGLSFSLTEYGLFPRHRSKLDLGFELGDIAWSYNGESPTLPDYSISFSLSYKFGS